MITFDSGLVEIFSGDFDHFRKSRDGDADVGDDRPASRPEGEAGVVELVTSVPQLVAIFNLLNKSL